MNRAFTGAAVLLSCAIATGCGKKGPPLLPYARIPAAAEITSARRVGNDVYVTVTVPSADIDEAKPASIQQIEIYAMTSLTPPTPATFLSGGATLVTTIPVARAADPSDKSGTVVPDPKTGALQGASATIRDSLSPDELTPAERPVQTGRSSSAGTGSRTPQITDVAAGAPQVLRRFYMTLPFSDRRRGGPPSAIVDVPLTLMPGKVPAIHAAMRGHSIVLEWEPADGLLGWLMDRALPIEAVPVDD